MTSTFAIEVLRTVDDIGRQTLDSFVDDGFFTYGWFKTLESINPLNPKPFYITAFEGSRIVAFAPCFLDLGDQFFDFSRGATHFIRRLLKARGRLHVGQDHVLLCYSPSCYRTRVFVEKRPSGNFLINAILSRIDDICRKEGILFSSFLFVSEMDGDLSGWLSNAGYNGFPNATSYYLDVRWKSFEEYLNNLKRVVRKRIRREIRRCVENGIVIEARNKFSDVSTELSTLSLNVLARYNAPKTELYEPSFFEKLDDYYASGTSQMFLAKKDGTLVGFSLNLRHKSSLDAFRCGFNYAKQEKSDFTYFNLVYYLTIKWAIEHNIKKIYFRPSADEVKLRFGCKPEKLYSYVKCQNRHLNFGINSYLKLKNGTIRAETKPAPLQVLV